MQGPEAVMSLTCSRNSRKTTGVGGNETRGRVIEGGSRRRWGACEEPCRQ